MRKAMNSRYNTGRLNSARKWDSTKKNRTARKILQQKQNQMPFGWSDDDTAFEEELYGY